MPGASTTAIPARAGSRLLNETVTLVHMQLQPGSRELTPPTELRDLLACLWIRVAPESDDPGVRVLPDACSDLIWKEGEGAFVAGPDTAAWLSLPAPGSLLV